MDHGGAVAVAEMARDFRYRVARTFARYQHGDMPGAHDPAPARIAEQRWQRQPEMLGDHLLDGGDAEQAGHVGMPLRASAKA